MDGSYKEEHKSVFFDFFSLTAGGRELSIVKPPRDILRFNPATPSAGGIQPSVGSASFSLGK